MSTTETDRDKNRRTGGKPMGEEEEGTTGTRGSQTTGTDEEEEEE